MSKGDELHHSNDRLLDLTNTIPPDDRKRISSILLNLLSLYSSDVIPTNEPINYYINKIRLLRLYFARFPLIVRDKLQLAVLSGLNDSLEPCNPGRLALYSTTFCLVELAAVRNPDRCDLESQHLATTLTKLVDSIIVPLNSKVIEMRTNLPSLISWSLCMLLYTHRACLDWIDTLDCQPDLVPTLDIDLKKLLDHPSLPHLMKIVLKLQIKRKPFPIPPPPYTLVEVLFSTAVSNNYKIINGCKSLQPDNTGSCPFDEAEPKPSKPNLSLAKDDTFKADTIKEVLDLPSDWWIADLQSDKPIGVLSKLRCLNLALLDNAAQANSDHNELLAATLQLSSTVLVRLWRDDAYDTYEKAFSLLLQLWYRSMERRELLTLLPQSYIWLAGFGTPRYESMSINGFFNASLWMSRFLTRYQSLFRSSILASPHWYLQFITSVVIAAIERAFKLAADSIDSTEDTLCACVISISRPFSALHPDDPKIRPELSRVLKVPLESIVACLAHQSGQSDRPISPRLRDTIRNHLLYPILRAIDPWCLGQSRMGIRPSSAKVMLNQLIRNAAAIAPSTDHLARIESAANLKQPAAVGGLHVAEQLAMKKKRIS